MINQHHFIQEAWACFRIRVEFFEKNKSLSFKVFILSNVIDVTVVILEYGALMF